MEEVNFSQLSKEAAHGWVLIRHLKARREYLKRSIEKYKKENETKDRTKRLLQRGWIGAMDLELNHVNMLLKIVKEGGQ